MKNLVLALTLFVLIALSGVGCGEATNASSPNTNAEPPNPTKSEKPDDNGAFADIRVCSIKTK